ncbi:hypothetical protein Fot_27709 [Forsythia ovata]|uniref:Uncharacterized protein n=1 Tax=Forsythia ovata TaxID=205694 RepID=A0ABD1TME8_9LAMI
MSMFNSERTKAWKIYTSSDPSTIRTEANRESSWNNFGSSMNAISFGFVATLILLSMFIIMAIFEHLFRPTTASDQDDATRQSDSMQMQKLGDQETVQTSDASNFTVLMPGQQCPTFIAQPAPLPCQRESVSWPSHQHSFALP